MRNLLAAIAFGAAVSACATAPYTPPPPAAPAVVYSGQVAPLHASLRLCPGAAAYNVGPVAYDRTVVDYRPMITTNAGPLLRNPTEFSCVSSGYGPREIASGGGRSHSGVDLANDAGGYIYAAGPGRIESVGWKGTYGLMVEIDHGAGVRTRYGHLSEVDPSLGPGSPVAGGVAIGRMGMTGNASGVHLHYELLIGGRAVDPLAYY